MNISFPQALQAVSGFSNGYVYALTKHKEDEIKQGKNYVLSGFTISQQFTTLCTVLNIINNMVPHYQGKRAVKIACQITPLLSMIFAPLCGAVKQGVYESGAKSFNQTMQSSNWSNSKLAYIHLPEKLSKRTVRIASFFAEYTGSFIRLAILSSAIALIALGNAPFGGALLTAVGLEALDSRGFIPRRISLFMEIYLPILINVGVLISGVIIAKIFSAITLCTFSSRFNTLLNHKVDAMIRKKVPTLKGPSLKQIDAPIVPQKEMSYAEIQEILDAPASHFKINPAHCSKPAIDLEKLPHDGNFNQYLSLFDKIDWESKHTFVKKKLQDDDRFMDHLSDKNPGVDKKILSQNIDQYIKELANKEGQTPEKYAATWTRKQIVRLVSILKGKTRVKGQQQDLDEAIQHCKVILPHLKALSSQQKTIDQFLPNLLVDTKVEIKDPILKLKLIEFFNLTDSNGNKFMTLQDDVGDDIELEKALLSLSTDNQLKIQNALSVIKLGNQIELEDALLKLAIEGGDYCGRGIKRATNEIIWGILESSELKASEEQKDLGDPIKGYEKKMLQALQNRRSKIVQHAYQALLNAMNVPNVISNDTHGFDIYRLYISLGLLPLSTFERYSIGLPMIVVWEMYEDLRNAEHYVYHSQLDSVVKEGGEIYFGLYNQASINNSTLMSDEEKEKVLDKYTECNDGKWTVGETESRFHRLLFLKLRVLDYVPV